MNTNAREQLEEAREMTVRVALPHLSDYRTCLYIGAKPKGFQLYDLLSHMNLTVLEACPANWRGLVADTSRPVERVHCGDVCSPSVRALLSGFGAFDLLVWWHGPEHVRQRAAQELLRPGGQLEALWTRAILLGCPWGRYTQGAVGGNPFERHRWSACPDWFHNLGYKTLCIGQRDKRGSHVTAWRTQ